MTHHFWVIVNDKDELGTNQVGGRMEYDREVDASDDCANHPFKDYKPARAVLLVGEEIQRIKEAVHAAISTTRHESDRTRWYAAANLLLTLPDEERDDET